jgi:hypothetical protein
MKLLDWLRPRREPKGDMAPAPSSADRARLEAKLQTARAETVFEPDDWSAIERLLGQGREQEVVELLRRWIADRPSDLDATMRLCELLCGRLEHDAARPLLERLLSSGPHQLRALLLLGEAAERAGQTEAARRAYERVLALDLDHRRARAAVDRLRPATPPARAADAVPPTLAQSSGDEPPIGGRYQLLRELGRGASGSVYLAEDAEVGRAVALKILHPSARRTADESRLRAWEEARTAAALRHPGAIAIYDLDEERQLIAMELCEGGALRDRLVAGPLRPQEALLALAQLAAVLSVAHEHGIVHGDVKPANLLLRRPLAPDAPPLQEDELVLCDFGLARLAKVGDAHAAAGTLAYMAPEQRRGRLEAPVDVYAAGMVALELLGVSDRSTLDRAALLRGGAWPTGTLPDALVAALGPAAHTAGALLTAVLAEDPTRRPSALEVAAAARALAEDTA